MAPAHGIKLITVAVIAAACGPPPPVAPGVLQPVGSDALRAQALARIGKMGAYIDADIANLREGYLAYEDQAQSQIDRYIAWPGQASAYMIGYLEITRLRAEAQQALGARFDLRAFHDRVLEDGAMPLPALRAKIQAWIRATVAERRG